MARKPNYQFEKRQKELERQARKAEKAQRRRERGESGEDTPDGAMDGTTDGIAAEGDAPATELTQQHSHQIPGAP
jgi:hypothetical protein